MNDLPPSETNLEEKGSGNARRRRNARDEEGWQHTFLAGKRVRRPSPGTWRGREAREIDRVKQNEAPRIDERRETGREREMRKWESARVG